MPLVFEGDLNGQGRRFGIVVSRFSKVRKEGTPLGEILLTGCLERLRGAGVADDDIVVSWVPGAFEIPLMVKAMASHGTDEDDDAGEFDEDEADETDAGQVPPRKRGGNGNGHEEADEAGDDDALHEEGEAEITIEGEIADEPFFDAVIALGCIIRGETPHFEFISTETARGLASVGLNTDVPVIFGVLTCDTSEQALARAGGEAGHMGVEAAEAALETANVYHRLREWNPDL